MTVVYATANEPRPEFAAKGRQTPKKLQGVVAA